ncbi:DUF1192 domain-containing protein [Stappia sp. F7233]|uniref:DUF1192 domain-containing protein n=1 Tax=Stappia albiluteola TaxID=2758565 RepID=A0A839AFF4_9HYPH|nr:DUF1192 domain-containing protein [Stappia albiluteola]MBA5777289.1 DUF1192 domain-containing protein [Stappia albiluteola]
MASRDDELPVKPAAAPVAIGDDLSRLSVDELSERLVLLAQEIERVTKERDGRSSVRAAADALFRK